MPSSFSVPNPLGFGQNFIRDLFTPKRSNIQRSGALERIKNSFPLGAVGSGLTSNRPPSIQDILARLEQLQDPSRYMMDPYQLETQARASAAAQYDPIISQLRNQMQLSENRGQRNKAELGNMFGSLSANLAEQIPAVHQNYENTKQNTQAEYDTLQKNIQGQYAQSQQDQEELFKRLNIEAAGAETLPEQMRDRDFFENIARSQAQTAQTALGTEQRGAEEFTRRGSDIARYEGTSRQADLMSQLEELLTSYQNQIGAQEAAKNQSYTAALSDLQRQGQQFALSQSQREFDNYLKQIQLGRDLRKDEQGLGASTVQSPADVARRALGLGLDPTSAQSLQNTFMTSVGSDPTILAGVDPVFGTSLPKEALAAKVVEQGRNSGLNQQQLNILHTIALEYFGRR